MAAGAGVLTLVPSVARPQSFPSRPITIIVPNPAGGPLDTVARIVAKHMQGSLGQPIIVENIPGASGSIGTGRIARASPDGYTLGIGNWSTAVGNGAILSLPYDVRKDFAPVLLLATQPMVIVARMGLPARDLKELVEWLKANPNKATQGTGGLGTLPHAVGVLFQKVTGTRFAFVPYRGISQAMQDLMTGQIDFMIDTAPNSLPQVRSRNIKAYAVTAAARLPSAPEIPTADEAGLPGFHFSAWQGLWAPKGTPQAIVRKVNVAAKEALAHPVARLQIAELGQEIPPSELQTPEALAAFQTAEIEKWWPILREAGIKTE
jgi:tripartite-type tricarboxylate transporter receptor subunit TctC